MLPLLPNEIILDILKLTVKSTTSAALNICLLSSDIGRLIRPILYRKVVIMNGRQDMAIRLDLAEFLQLHLHALSLDLYLSSGYLPGGLGSAPDKVGEPGGFWRAPAFFVDQPRLPAPRSWKHIDGVSTSPAPLHLPCG